MVKCLGPPQVWSMNPLLWFGLILTNSSNTGNSVLGTCGDGVGGVGCGEGLGDDDGGLHMTRITKIGSGVMLDIGGWASKLVFLGSSSLTNFSFLMVISLLPSPLIICCSLGSIPTMSVWASKMFSTVHFMVYLNVAFLSPITSSLGLVGKLSSHCVGQDIVSPLCRPGVFTNP